LPKAARRARPRLHRRTYRRHRGAARRSRRDLWETIEKSSGLPRADIEKCGNIYAKAKSVIINYGMGITQHRHGTGNVQQIANLLMLRGNIGRPGAGISPLRGHSNVQGDRTVGITELPNAALLDGIERTSASSRRRRMVMTPSRR
jgi:anaerobic selenocysteine-containing dehydrogenase